MYKHYNKIKARWSILIATMTLGLLSVIPFYGMAVNANMLYTFVIGNSIARFCMDHYSWQAVTATVLDTGVKFKKSNAVGYITFACGVLTAMYLYPFAKSASNVAFAILGVAPTCLLWGLDSKASWVRIFDWGSTKIKNYWRGSNSENRDEPIVQYDKDLYRGKIISLITLITAALAGALSETMMAAANAKELFFPGQSLAIFSAIAFFGIYLTGPFELVNNFFNFLQGRRQNENGEALRQKADHQLVQYFKSKAPADKSSISEEINSDDVLVPILGGRRESAS